MSWEPELEELKRREAFAEELGGAERVKRQKDGGRLTIRERVEQMADSDSFRPQKTDAVKFCLRTGQNRWSAGDYRRRRLYGSWRIRRRYDQGKAQYVRADGQRIAPTAYTHGRRFRRWRLR